MFRAICILPVIVVTLPLQLCIALCVFVTSGWPVFYQQRRVGKFGRVFVLYKFRSMVLHADNKKKEYLSINESDGPAFKIHNDPRFTSIGRFLSHTGLDELPQLWNVLRGEMALIGPRPLPISEVGRLAPWMRKRHDILPGIISPAILSGTYHQDFVAWMKSDIEYATSKSMVTDATLFMQIIPFLFGLLRREFTGRA